MCTACTYVTSPRPRFMSRFKSTRGIHSFKPAQYIQVPFTIQTNGLLVLILAFAVRQMM